MAMHSAFEIEVLGWVADDYEAPHTIAGDIARETRQPTTEADVLAALLALTRDGLVQAYTVGPQDFTPITHAEAATAADPWFMITTAGRAEFERHAN